MRKAVLIISIISGLSISHASQCGSNKIQSDSSTALASGEEALSLKLAQNSKLVQILECVGTEGKSISSDERDFALKEIQRRFNQTLADIASSKQFLLNEMQKNISLGVKSSYSKQIQNLNEILAAETTFFEESKLQIQRATQQ